MKPKIMLLGILQDNTGRSKQGLFRYKLTVTTSGLGNKVKN